MNNKYYKGIAHKSIFVLLFALIAPTFTINSNILANEQTKSSKDLFDGVKLMKMKDPLAVALGAMGKDDVFTFTYNDAVKCAGHSCPAVAGAYKSTQLALETLYGNDIPVRGNIKVAFSGGVDYKVNGPISQVVTFITGASTEAGFKGLGPGGKYSRFNLMTFDKDIMPDPKATSSITFQRTDNGKKLEVTYYAEKAPVSERIDKLMPLVISGKASEEESKEFGNLWQERVKTILLSPPEGTFVVKDITE
ncbi:MAG TPA: hypothetical protein ACFYD7_09925 [Candidatus Wujingus californicus]|uniref:hypothetical protein n=1 Tax=Candidatus Wujingus californicus TaxID=3367618 RepID=UPI001DA1E0DB|nr:hypothetical protein [Planctomycetota bacterium]MDO8131784.1 hypothetical protein [Candidatus Brocadiales bacterium]